MRQSTPPPGLRRLSPCCDHTAVSATGSGRTSISALLWQHWTVQHGARCGGCAVIRRTLNHLDWVQEQLAHAVAEPLVRESCTRLWS